MATAYELKDQGNIAFQRGDYRNAENLYTSAILKNPTLAVLFTNRAVSRLRLAEWEMSIQDSLKALEIESDNLKAYYYLAQAQAELNRPSEALTSALRSYEICLQKNSLSTQNVCSLILTLKRQRWAKQFRDRIMAGQTLLRTLNSDLQIKADAQLLELETGTKKKRTPESEFGARRAEITHQLEMDQKTLLSAFTSSAEEKVAIDGIPEHFLDPITFNIMFDPVVTTAGHSFERASIEQYLRKIPRDPFTRAPLTIEELRPNLNLKAACEDFMERYGWNAEW